MAEKEKKDVEEKKKRRRIKGDAFWKIQGFQKRILKAQEELNEWEISKAEELGLYPDQINWATGAIFDDKAEIRDGKVVNAQVISRLPHEVLRAHKEQGKVFKELSEEMDAFRNNLARKMKVWPDMIDISTGIVADNSWDEIDPDTITEEPEEVVTEE